MEHQVVVVAFEVACVLDPSVVEVREARVTVELTDRATSGAIRFSFTMDRSGAPVRVALRADHDRFVELLVEALGTVPTIG